MRKRVAAVIVRDGKLLLMQRKRNGQEYFVFAGGGVEEGETPEQALKREIREEFMLDIEIDRLLLKLSRLREEYYFLVTRFSGTPVLGGEEKEFMTERNQYAPIWVELQRGFALRNLYPTEARHRLATLLGVYRPRHTPLGHG